MSDKTLTLAGALGSLMNGISRIFWPILEDRYGFKPVMAVVLTMQTIAILFINSSKDSAPIYTTLIVLTFMSNGAYNSIFPNLAVKIFGIENGG